jgi:hypothetical protein
MRKSKERGNCRVREPSATGSLGECCRESAPYTCLPRPTRKGEEEARGGEAFHVQSLPEHTETSNQLELKLRTVVKISFLLRQGRMMHYFNEYTVCTVCSLLVHHDASFSCSAKEGMSGSSLIYQPAMVNEEVQRRHPCYSRLVLFSHRLASFSFSCWLCSPRTVIDSASPAAAATDGANQR